MVPVRFQMAKIQSIIIYMKDKPASKEVVERSLAQIREILGIQRGEKSDGTESLLFDRS